MKCETCLGKGFIEKEHGLFRIKCLDCNGTGEVEDAPTDNGDTIENSNGDNPITRSTDTSEPTKPKASKRKKRARKGNS